MHARADVAEASEMHVLMATSLSAIRDKLQQIKHADEGTDEERDTITNCLVGLEAFLHLGIGLSWAMVPDAPRCPGHRLVQALPAGAQPTLDLG